MKFLSVGKIKVVYKVVGRGIPILIIHGFCLDHRAMAGCLEQIFRKKRGFKRIYVDLPGMGLSQSPRKVKSANQMLRLLLRFIDKVVGRKTFLVIGYSYGGYLARGILHRLKKRVDGLAMFCPVVIADQKRRDLPRHSVHMKSRKLSDHVQRCGDEKEKEAFGSLVIQKPGIWNRCKKEIVTGLRSADPATIGAMEKSYNFTFENRLKDRSFKPCLVMSGRNDHVVGFKDQLKLLKRYPNGCFVTVDRAGHNLQIEQPKVFSDLLGQWLDQF